MLSYISVKKCLVVLCFLSLVGCSQGVGDQEDLEQVIGLSADISDSEAACLADKIFDEYGDNDDDIRRISELEFSEITGADEKKSVDGFAAFYATALADC